MRPMFIYASTSFAANNLVTSARVEVGAKKIVRITIGGIAARPVDVWFKLGDSAVVATAGSNGESLISANGAGCVTFTTLPHQTHVALIADSAFVGADTSTATASVELIG